MLGRTVKSAVTLFQVSKPALTSAVKEASAALPKTIKPEFNLPRFTIFNSNQVNAILTQDEIHAIDMTQESRDILYASGRHF